MNIKANKWKQISINVVFAFEVATYVHTKVKEA